MPAAGAVLLENRYRLDERLAAGGFGEVWRATDVLLNRPVAIKLLHPGYTQHPETMARFRFEARNAGSLCHENIARVFDYGEPPAANAPFLVMELVNGPSLAGLLPQGPLPPARVMDIVAQVAAGLDAAHRAGLVHRDVKPGNLLVGPDGVVKISDFGISHAAGSAPVTRTGMIVGTPAYIAPERVSGGRASAASDLYSLGVVAWECLAGAAPFGGVAMEIALAHRDRPLPPLPDTVPAGVAALVAELTAKDPAARPASAGEVARRAAGLRDLLTAADGAGAGVIAAPGGAEAGAEAARAVPADGGGFHTTPLPGLPVAARRAPRSGRRIAGRAAIALISLAAVAAGLILISTVGPTAPGRPAAVPSSTASPTEPGSATLMVNVNRGSLVGQPVSAVVARLRRLGLVTGVLWRRSDQQPSGRVLSVWPAGRLAAGSHVTVAGALPVPVLVHRHVQNQPPGHTKPKPAAPATAKPPGHIDPGLTGHAKHEQRRRGRADRIATAADRAVAMPG